MKKVLVLGGTGAMGTYLVPNLARRGWQVDVVSLDERENKPGIRYFRRNAILADQLREGYDGIVDFMHYGTDHYRARHKLLLENTDHLIFLSSYRVFMGSDGMIRENSSQFLDDSDDAEYLATDEYGLAKSRCEDILEQSGYHNWTIVRPAITYSQKRAQLVTLERKHILAALREKRPIRLPADAEHVQGTMTWAGDVTEMFARLLFDSTAMGQAFNTTTAEHNTWGTVAQMYKDIFGLDFCWVDEDNYFKDKGAFSKGSWWQLHYDRLLDRRMDNTKVLRQTGLKQSDLKPLYEGLLLERDNILEDL